MNDAMSEKGFYIAKSNIPPSTPEFIADLKSKIRKSKNLRTLFNMSGPNGPVEEELPEFGDQLRLQLNFTSARWSVPQKQVIEDIKAKMFEFLPERHCLECYFLLSEAGCLDQTCHTDYPPRQRDDDGVCSGHSVSALIALEPETEINVWPGSINFDPSVQYQHERIKLDVGDIFFFRSDLVHSGASYSNRSNVRAFCFLDREIMEREEEFTGDMTCYSNLSPIK